MSESNRELEARLPEGESFEPAVGFTEQANVSDTDIYDQFDATWPECWESAAELLDWESGWEEVLVDDNPPFYEWFVGGQLNASYNCIDRHVGNGRETRTAIRWIGEHGEERTFTYGELQREVNACAAALRDLGVQADDIVTLYLPMIPALPIAMLACARIGAPHSVVFAGFSAEALATRMEAADSEVLVTCDGYYRRGEPLDHQEKASMGIGALDGDATVVNVERLGDALAQAPEPDWHNWDALLEKYRGTTIDPVSRNAEDMLFLMYTSGTTGQPKGVKHTTGGYLSYAAWTSQSVLDIKPDDTYWCAADIGWITGHSYIVYGPLALGTTTVMYEGAPDYPDKDRLWDIVETHSVDIFYTAPTAVRAFMKWGTQFPKAHDLSSLRLLGTVGEPINPAAWKWYYTHIGDESCPIVDTWWQTETGGMMVTTLPGIGTMKPGSAGPPLPGIDARVVDEKGQPVDSGGAGYLTVNRPWPGMLRTLYRNDERFIEEYWATYSDTSSEDPDDWVYFPEDGAKIDEDGHITILGRVDDVVNVSGHRLGTMEIESAVVEVDGVAEAAVVGADHEIKGESIYTYVITEEDAPDVDAIRADIISNVERVIGPFARPEKVIFTPELPKTRSGKIMRRLLEDIANEKPLGSTSTLRNPDIVEEIQGRVSNTD